MQPTSREMQAIAASAAGGQISLDDLHNGHAATVTGGGGGHDDFFDQMLNNLPSAWPDLGEAAGGVHKLFGVGLAGKSPEDVSAADGMQFAPYDESVLLASRLRQHQIGGGGGGGGIAKPMMLQLNDLRQNHSAQMMLPAMRRSSPASGGGGGDGLLLPLTLGSGGSRDEVEALFKSPNSTGGEGLYGGFAGSLQQAAAQQQQHFHHPQQAAASMPANQNYGGATGAAAQPPAGGVAATGGAPAPPRQRVRARRGQATDPHSIAERLRRERIAERMKALQELVPNANKTDKASMLDEIIDYVKFLQLQVKVLSMSRLGGAAAVAPLVADMSSEGRGSNGTAASDSLTVTEHQVAKLMEEDMGTAMQYLQGKGLCLMPISLASAISSATCHLRPPTATTGPAVAAVNALMRMPNANAGGDGPASPSMSVLTAQSAMANGGVDGDGSQPKDAASVSKP